MSSNFKIPAKDRALLVGLVEATVASIAGLYQDNTGESSVTDDASSFEGAVSFNQSARDQQRKFESLVKREHENVRYDGTGYNDTTVQSAYMGWLACEEFANEYPKKAQSKKKRRKYFESVLAQTSCPIDRDGDSYQHPLAHILWRGFEWRYEYAKECSMQPSATSPQEEGTCTPVVHIVRLNGKQLGAINVCEHMTKRDICDAAFELDEVKSAIIAGAKDVDASTSMVAVSVEIIDGLAVDIKTV